MIRNFENLSIWKKSRALVKQVYILARNFPPEERFSLVRQIKRCGISIPSNIAEGCGRRTNKELIYFLDIAIGSLCELETQLYLSYDLDFLKKNEIQPVINEIIQIRKMTISFQNTIK